MASYLSNYDPNSYAVQGYQLPNEQIMNAINNRTQYYISAAQNIKNQYDSVFGVQLTNKQNQEQLKQAKELADSQLSKIMKKDLSIGDYSAQAMKVYEPVTKNKNFIYDETLTKRVYSGINQSQSDLKKNGSKTYNPLSVQVMQNTLDDWANDDPNNVDKYLSDGLGTTYQPYDTAASQKNLLNIKNSIKTYKRENPTQIGGSHYIVTQEGKELTGLQAIEYVNAQMLPQDRTQNQLRARLDYRNGQAIIKQSGNDPNVINHVNAQFDSLKEATIAQRGALYDNQIQFMRLQKSLFPSADSRQEQWSKNIEELETTKKKDETDFRAQYKSGIYGDPREEQQAMSQISDFYDNRMVNGIASGLGLDNPTIQYKQDAAAISAMNLEYNMQKDQASRLMEQAKLWQKQGMLGFDAQGNPMFNGSGMGANPASPYIQDSPIVSDPEYGKEFVNHKKLEIAGKVPGQQDQVKKTVLQQSGFVLQNGKGEQVDALSFMDDPANAGMTFGDMLSRIPNEELRRNLSALVDNAYYLTNPVGEDKNPTLNRPGAASMLPLNMTSMRLRALLSNQDMVDKLTTKLGIDNSNFDVGSNLAGQMELSNNEQKNNEKMYGHIYKDAAKKIGWVNAPDVKGLFVTTKADFYKSQIDFMKSQGLGDADIQKAISYAEGKTQYAPNVSSNSYSDASSVQFFSDYFNGPNPAVHALDQKWEAYQGLIDEGLRANAGAAASAQERTFSNFDENKSMPETVDPNRILRSIPLTDLIRSSVGSIEGGPVDKTMNSLKNMLDTHILDESVVSGIRIINTSTGPYIRIIPNDDATQWKKLMGDANTSGVNQGWEDFAQNVGKLLIPATPEIVQKYFGASQQNSAEKWAQGNTVEMKLPSMDAGGLNIYHNGTDVVLDAKPMTIQKNGDLFKVERFPIKTTNNQGLGFLYGNFANMTMEGVKAQPERAALELRNYDKASYELKNYLTSQKIEPDAQGFYTFSKLPSNVQQHIKQHFSKYFNY